MEEEEDLRKKAVYAFEEYIKRQNALEQASSAYLSEKASGKRRQIESDEDLLPDPHDLPPDMRKSLDLLRSRNSNQLLPAINALMPDVEYKLDRLDRFVNEARTTMRVAEDMLNKRFRLLSANMEKRRGGGSDDVDHGVDVVHHYVEKEKPPGGGLRDLLRSMSRIDSTRHPSKIGDSARRAAREVQRIGDGGRRLTAVYANGGTPRKAPGTPRRERT
jgi:kinetochore protein Mis13/DSN1